ncbi:MAG TPA: cupredoxin domain-containing protein [Nitrospiria bacterium]|jgi:plastocyanin
MFGNTIQKAFIGAFLISLSFFPLNAHADEDFKLISVLVGEGGNIWLPSTIIVEKGKEVKLSLNNLVNKEHGFTIEGLDVKEVIKAGGSKEISLKPAKAGVYRYFCHLHKGHVGGQLLVQ